MCAENILRKHSSFFFKLEKIKYRNILATSFGFAVTSRKIIISNGNNVSF